MNKAFFSFDNIHLGGEHATHPIARFSSRLAALRTPSLESVLRTSLRLSQSAPCGLVLLVAFRYEKGGHAPRGALPANSKTAHSAASNWFLG
jgi:hypothetical protein